MGSLTEANPVRILGAPHSSPHAADEDFSNLQSALHRNWTLWNASPSSRGGQRGRRTSGDNQGGLLASAIGLGYRSHTKAPAAGQKFCEEATKGAWPISCCQSCSSRSCAITGPLQHRRNKNVGAAPFSQDYLSY